MAFITQEEGQFQVEISAAAPAGYSDTFAGTNGVHLLDHHMTGDGTSHWTAVVNAAGADNIFINDNAAAEGAWGEALVGFASPSTADSSMIAVRASFHHSAMIAPCIRMPANNLGYYVKFAIESGGNWTLMQVGKNADAEFHYLSGSWATASAHTIRIVMTTGSILAVYVDGTLADHTIDDSAAPLAAGNSGIYLGVSSGSIEPLIDACTDQSSF
jgi:hypothetical protein